MKFEIYLKENEKLSKKDVISMIKKDCKPFLKTMRNFFYRGTKQKINDIKELTPRFDRRPLTTKKIIHDMFDKLTKEKFGWKVRSEGVFATTNFEDTKSYGTPYMFFPIGNFKFIYSPIIRDFLLALPAFEILNFKPPLGDLNELEFKLFNMLKTYTNKNLKKSGGNEVMFKCKSYYLVDTVISEYIIDDWEKNK